MQQEVAALRGVAADARIYLQQLMLRSVDSIHAPLVRPQLPEGGSWRRARHRVRRQLLQRLAPLLRLRKITSVIGGVLAQFVACTLHSSRCNDARQARLRAVARARHRGVQRSGDAAKAVGEGREAALNRRGNCSLQRRHTQQQTGRRIFLHDARRLMEDLVGEQRGEGVCCSVACDLTQRRRTLAADVT